jgi:ABC-type lipoprotein release transport system permease subunit
MLGTTFRIALRNLGRSRRRTALTLAAIAIAQLGVLAMNGFMNGRVRWTIDTVTGPLVGHVQVHAEDWREEQAPDLVIEDASAVLAAIRSTEGVASAYARLYAPALAAHEIDGYAAVVIGVDPVAENAEGGLLEGLPPEARPHEHHVLVGRALARANGIEVGDELALLGQGADGSMANDLVTVAGILETPVEIVDSVGVVMAMETAQEIFVMPDMAHEITIRGAGSGETAGALGARLAALPALAGYEVLPWHELAPELAASVDQSEAIGLFVLFVVFIAAAAGVSNTMLMATFERRRELGMLLSLGTTPRRLIGMILAEAVALGLAGVVVGSVLGGLSVLWMGVTGVSMAPGSDADAAAVSVYGVTLSGVLRPYLDAGDYLGGVIGVSVVSVLAAVWPAWLTARLEPVEAMRS